MTFDIRTYLDADKLVEPLRYCGRQWNFTEMKTSEVALRVIFSPLLILATALSMIPAAFTHLFSAHHIPSVILKAPGGNLEFNKISNCHCNEHKLVKKSIGNLSVSIDDIGTPSSPEQYISRKFTFSDSSQNPISRLFNFLYFHLSNKKAPELAPIYKAIFIDEQSTGDLDTILKIFQAVSIFITDDLASVKISVY